MPARPWGILKKLTERKFGSTAYSKLLKFIKKGKPYLWGETQPRDYLEKNLVATLIKDLEGKGYDKILSENDFGMHFNHSTFQHNAGVLRKLAMEWGMSTCHLRSAGEWTAAMAHMKKLPAPFKKLTAVLYQDSTDFPLQRSKTPGYNEANWSGKLKRPARRFQVIRNCKGKLIQVWGGYTPKIMDQWWLDQHKIWIEQHLQDANIFADTHYSGGKTLFKKVSYHTKHLEFRGKTKIDLTKKQLKENQAIDAVRARVELPFGWIKNRFKALSLPWAESIEQLDALVWTAVGAYNYQH